MSIGKVLHVSAFCLIQASCLAQAVDNMASFRMVNAERYVRIHYENDYFTGTDVYYTQGINLEMVNPSYRKFPLSKLLIAPKNSNRHYGISLEHNGYTPTSITHDNILYGDRPFAAALFLKTFCMSDNPTRHYRMTSSFSLGVIGTAASGYWMQRTIHRWLNGTVPRGWENQIRNDVVLNYETGIEKTILHGGSFFMVNGFADARVGTLNDKLSTGLVIMAGKLNSAITHVFLKNQDPSSSKEKFSFHVYMQPLVNVVGYDATMQGGVFNRESPYTLSSKEMELITLQANYGVAVTFHALYLEYFQSILSKEFETGSQHRWGGIRIGVAF